MGRGGGPFVIRRAGGGGIGFIIVIFVVMMFFGINPLELLQNGGSIPGGSLPGQQTQTAPTQSAGETDEMRDFVATVLAETEDVWNAVFADLGLQYEEPRLILFSGSYRFRLRFRQRGHRAVLLSGRQEHLHRPVLLRGTPQPLPGAGRFRPGLRACA